MLAGCGNLKIDRVMDGVDDFIKEENRKDGKQDKVSEDYIHSFIAQHERDYEPEEE